VNCFCLGPEQIDDLWPLYGHHLERYEQETGTDYAGQIRADLRASHKQLWGFQEGDRILGVMVTRVFDTPKGQVCEIYALCGTSERGLAIDINEILPHIERWAVEKECVRVRLNGRRGWKHFLTDYRETGVTMEKEL
jgi:hypothetical protein